MKSNISRNPVLTYTAARYMRNPAGFVALRLAPLFLTGEQSASYYVFNAENMLNVPTDLRRAPSSGYKRSKMVLSDDTYSCKEYGIEEPVDDRERKKYASALDADTAAVKRAVDIIRINHEIRVRDLANSGSVTSSGVGTKWDAANSTPVKDVKAACQVVRKACGQKPNLMVVNEDTFDVLAEHPTVLEKIKYTQRGVVTAEILAAVFGVREIAVAGQAINTANEGQAQSINDLWADNVILAVTDASADLQALNFIRTFGWIGEVGPDGVLVESYREDPTRSDVHRARQDTDEKLVGAACGYRLNDVLT